MPPRPRPEIESVRNAVHGGFHANEWRTLGEIIDFSSNVNPFGASPRVAEALQRVPIAVHPDPTATELREAIATRTRLMCGQVIVGNGSLELIRALAIAFLRTDDCVLIAGPTFGEYRVAAQVMGAQIDEACARREQDFQPEVAALAAQVKKNRPRLVFLCNPNNPTGVYLTRAQIAQLLDASSETLWVLDEAFIAFVEPPWRSDDLLSRHDNLVIVRSMTKDYALAGLRLGYALAAPEVIVALDKVRAPWSVNAFAQAAGLAVLADGAFLQQTLPAVRAASRDLQLAITRLGWRVVPSAVHFFLVQVGDAGTFRAALATRGLIVRDCSSFGLPDFIRIATRTPRENAKLISALESLRNDSRFRGEPSHG